MPIKFTPGRSRRIGRTNDGHPQSPSARPAPARRSPPLQSQTDMMESVLEVDPAVYTDPEIATRERERVFGRVPFAVAHCTEIAEPGSFITSRLPNNEAIIVRQHDGGVRALVNVCRHRGSMVEAQEAGTCKKFQCPYHGWSYNIDGSLKSATHEASFGDFDHLDRGLISLPVEERHGFIWVIDSPGRRDRRRRLVRTRYGRHPRLVPDRGPHLRPLRQLRPGAAQLEDPPRRLPRRVPHPVRAYRRRRRR